MKPAHLRPLLVLSAFLCLASCTQHVSPQEVAALKDKSLVLMTKATEPYSLHVVEATDLKTRMSAARAIEAKSKHNQAAVDMWTKLANPEGSLLGGFLSGWEKTTTVSAAFIPEKKGQVEAAFNKIAASTQPPR